MNSNNGNAVFSAFRDLVRKRVPEESCDLCSAPLRLRHAHLLEVAQRQVMCACTSCAVLFTDSMTRFRRIPRDVRHLPDCRLTDEHWAALGIPINLAFVFRSSVTGLMTSLYPSPGGAIESLSPADVWEEIVTDEPRLAKMQDDVQAFLRTVWLSPISTTWLRSINALNWSVPSACIGRDLPAAPKSGSRSRTCLLG